ncbi:MAG: tRNA 4-thiouridine(8) synthase ThiI [Erysipelothrix sp.]|jgi:thiamine biosynthesis protein ThiI|nr:tRNA 4-thiouridine(8) synthase ThiI [Erysipelothrix sp.]
MRNKILCRLGEVSTKIGNRNEFIKILKKNVQVTLRDFDNIVVDRSFDRMIISYDAKDQEPIVDALQHVFGLSSYSVIEVVPLDLDVIVDTALKQMQTQPTATFKVFTKRSNKNFPFISDQINRAVAGAILKATDHTVDVHHPEIPVRVEIKQNEAYVSVQTYPGLKGMPVRMAGRGALLLSGGFDSPVAGYLANKRGLEYIAIHFETMPYTSLQALDKVLKLAQKISVYQNQTHVHVVPFTMVQLAINQHVPESYRITIMRRMMVRIANMIAKANRARVLISGESLGQVASQTISSLETINAVSSQLILRPVITYDKMEIIELARSIDTYDLSTLPYDDCCTVFTPKHPTTNPSIAKATKYESFHDFEPLLQTAVVETKKYIVNKEGITLVKE